MKSCGEAPVDTWVDMESGIRNKETDEFSIEKCRQVLEVVEKNLDGFH